jgi:hypothetical protein
VEENYYLIMEEADFHYSKKVGVKTHYYSFKVAIVNLMPNLEVLMLEEVNYFLLYFQVLEDLLNLLLVFKLVFLVLIY